MTSRSVSVPDTAQTLAEAFAARVAATPDRTAYREYDPVGRGWRSLRWREVAAQVARLRAALRALGLAPGERVAIMAPNGSYWVACDQAALAEGLVVVPLFANDRAENAAYVINHCGARVLFIQGLDQWRVLSRVSGQLGTVERIIAADPVIDAQESRLTPLDEWLPPAGDDAPPRPARPDDLATIIYTSGTTGRPKGVMLSHANILSNARAGVAVVPVSAADRFLSFLPLSHALERTAGYYLPLLQGAEVAFARSIRELADDIVSQRPTVLISVPRVFERMVARIREQAARSPAKARLLELAVDIGWQAFRHRQGRAAWHPRLLLAPLLDLLVGGKLRARLGGRLRVAICGGAALVPEVGRMLLGLGVNLQQGYGLSETSPIISVNPAGANEPESVGVVLPGVEVRIGPDSEVQVRGPGVMLGYWQDAEASARALTPDGWLHTGDQGRLERGHLTITGRIKDIIVLANGEKVPPVDLESAILADPLFEQVLVVGEGRPFLAALAVLNPERWQVLARDLGVEAGDAAALRAPQVEATVVDHLRRQLARFPGYARIHRVHLLPEPWTVEDGLITPTLKLRRRQIIERHIADIETLYAGH